MKLTFENTCYQIRNLEINNVIRVNVIHGLMRSLYQVILDVLGPLGEAEGCQFLMNLVKKEKGLEPLVVMKTYNFN